MFNWRHCPERHFVGPFWITVEPTACVWLSFDRRHWSWRHTTTTSIFHTPSPNTRCKALLDCVSVEQKQNMEFLLLNCTVGRYVKSFLQNNCVPYLANGIYDSEYHVIARNCMMQNIRQSPPFFHWKSSSHHQKFRTIQTVGERSLSREVIFVSISLLTSSKPAPQDDLTPMDTKPSQSNFASVSRDGAPNTNWTEASPLSTISYPECRTEGQYDADLKIKVGFRQIYRHLLFHWLWFSPKKTIWMGWKRQHSQRRKANHTRTMIVAMILVSANILFICFNGPIRKHVLQMHFVTGNEWSRNASLLSLRTTNWTNPICFHWKSWRKQVLKQQTWLEL